MYIPCLNGIRAYAIILVLLAHFLGSPNIPPIIRDLLGFAGFGTIGVRLFFLLSGFLITHVLVLEYEKNKFINIKSFFIRRILRIFPCFYVYLIALFLLKSASIIEIETNALLFSLFYVQNLNVFQKSHAFTTSWLVKHSWSLSVEEQFYLFYPFFFARIKKLIKYNGILFLLISCLFCTFFRALNYSFPDISRYVGGPFLMHIDFLLWGCVIRLLYKKYSKKIITHVSPFKNLLLILSLILSAYASRIEYYNGINIMICGVLILLSNAYFLLYFLLFPNSTIGIMFENSYFGFIGKLSYSLYVWQQLFLGSSNLWLKYHFMTYAPINILCIFAFAVFSYYIVEKPFLRLKTRFSTV